MSEEEIDRLEATRPDGEECEHVAILETGICQECGAALSDEELDAESERRFERMYLRFR